LGAKKKESTNFDALCICEGDCVSVENHGKHWIHLGHIISIDKNTKTAVVKWEETRKKDTVHLGDCKNYNKLDIIPRKWKSTDFFCEIPQTKRGRPPPGQMTNMFFPMKQADRACGMEISPRLFVISFLILYVCNIVQYWYLIFCHYVSS
jgi:hypothetical protein